MFLVRAPQKILGGWSSIKVIRSMLVCAQTKMEKVRIVYIDIAEDCPIATLAIAGTFNSLYSMLPLWYWHPLESVYRENKEHSHELHRKTVMNAHEEVSVQHTYTTLPCLRQRLNPMDSSLYICSYRLLSFTTQWLWVKQNLWLYTLLYTIPA